MNYGSQAAFKKGAQNWREMKKIILISFILLSLGSLLYYKFIFTPNQILQTTFLNFQNTIYKHDSKKLKKLFHRKAMIYKYLDQIEPLMNKFETKILVKRAFFIPHTDFYDNKYGDVISGGILLKAKIDLEYRYIEVDIIKDINSWKIIKLVFPDYLDY